MNANPAPKAAEKPIDAAEREAVATAREFELRQQTLHAEAAAWNSGDGKIHVMREVHCASCFATDVVTGSFAYAKAEFKKAGWRKTQKGWECPKHTSADLKL